MLGKNIIVSGGSGTISSAVINGLLDDGAMVYALTRKEELEINHPNLKVVHAPEISNLNFVEINE